MFRAKQVPTRQGAEQGKEERNTLKYCAGFGLVVLLGLRVLGLE